MYRVLKLATVGLCATVALMNTSPAAAEPGHDLKRWYFAEGSTNVIPGLALEEELLIGNPNGTDAQVTLRFLPSGGGTPIVTSFGVPARSRAGINARQFIAQGDAAVEVTSDVDIVVERSMYWGKGKFNFGPGYTNGPITDMRGGHSTSGVNQTRTSWSFAEGSVGYFQTYVLVSNPNDVAATVRVKYLTGLGEEVSEVRNVAPGSRETFAAYDALTAQLGARPQFDFAIEVVSENSVGVVAERAMYWNNFGGGHASVGVTPQASWLFAEGVQAAGLFDTYVLLFNPNAQAVTVAVNFYGQNGLLEPVVVDIPARSRANVPAQVYPSLANQAFSISVTAAGNAPIVAERAVYRVAPGGFGDGTVASGLPTPALKWGFAEGQEGGFQQFQDPADPDKRLFSTYYQVLNDSDVAVTVRGVFYVEPGEGVPAGSGFETTKVINPRSRETFATSLFPDLHNRKFSAFFEASGPVVVERATFWGSNFRGGHAASGTPLPDAFPPLASPLPMPAPTLLSITPTRGVPSGGTPVVIKGTGLGLLISGAGDTTVFFGITPVPQSSITVLDANTISLITPASGRGVAGLVVRTRGVELFNPNVLFEFFDPYVATGAPFGGLPNRLGDVAALANRLPFAMFNSCRNHDFMYELVAELRLRDNTNRWGLNWKRGIVGDFSHDIVNYYYGPEGTDMRNNTQVWIVDMIGGHCGPGPHAAWQDQTGATRAAGTVGRWTTAPMCGIPRYRDARRPNGEWLFPECR